MPMIGKDFELRETAAGTEIWSPMAGSDAWVYSGITLNILDGAGEESASVEEIAARIVGCTADMSWQPA